MVSRFFCRMMSTPTRWAIAGPGSISADFASALSLAPRTEHILVSVASRSLERAQEFAKTHNIPRTHGSYEDMVAEAKDGNKIDVVYIGTIHPYHQPVCEIFLNAGVNVLCEKPLTVNTRQAKGVIDLARRKNLFLMEGYWSRFFPAYAQLKQELASGCIGEPRFVLSNFGINLQHMKDAWFHNKEMAGGILLTLGCYNVQLAQLVFNYEKPQKIVATGVINDETGVDSVLSVTLMYSDNKMAVLNSSQETSLDGTATINGSVVCGTEAEKAMIKIPNLWCPTEIITPHGTKQFPLKNKSPTPTKRINSEGMIYEADAVRDCLLKGLKQHPLCSWEHTLQHMEILDEIRRQIGLEYKWDKE